MWPSYAERTHLQEPLDDRQAVAKKEGSRERSRAMNGRPRTKASKKRRMLVKKERREKKTISRVMPMLSRPKKKAIVEA
jgi:hypothetical protein